MKKISLFLAILTCFNLITSDIFAKCRREAKVKYETTYGWSKLYSVEVIFLTGLELNRATTSIDYNSFSNYAVIFWAEGEATVIEIDSLLFCGVEFECDCLENQIFDLEGQDQDGDKWIICIKSFCF